MQITTDGHKVYAEAIEAAFGADVDYAMLVKIYGASYDNPESRYSPMNYRDLSPLYMKEAQGFWYKHEQPLELLTILEQNFVEENDEKWRVPNPNKEADLEQLRNRALLKEFQQSLETLSPGTARVLGKELMVFGRCAGLAHHMD